MSDRTQWVRIGHEVPDPTEVAHGVPQGSILGPALFNIHINDLPSVTHLCSLKSYVDDSQQVHLMVDLQRLVTWCCAHSLLINPDKTKLLLLGIPHMLSRVREGFAVSLLRKEILPSPSAKSLGVVIDSHLSFYEQVTDLISRCTGSLCQIGRVKYLFDRSTLIKIINDLVFSKLFYYSSVWAGVTKKNIERLRKVQNFAVRIVTDARKFEHITPYLKDLCWLQVAMQLEVRDVIMTYKSLDDLTLRNVLTTRSVIYKGNTRNNDTV